ncbi:MAG: Flp family type IVb pilin [Sphingomonadales bacterium]|nr:Flp family type IVb pilin [Sphingomonadaceae bacterium]MBS3931260.1 Flp family type IVb pilin [Sphingomonadales bacterium]
MAFFRKLLADNTGTAAVEYGVICGLMVVGLLAGVTGLGAEVGSSFNDTAAKVQNATGN